MSNRRTRGQVRLWGGLGMAAAVAAMIGMGTAHADTTDEVIGQAVSDLNQGNALLDAAPTTDLSAQQADFLLIAQGANETSFLTDIGTQQDLASASDQPFLAGAD